MTSSQAQVGLLVALPEELAQIQSQLVRASGRQQTHGRSGSDYELFCHPDYDDLTIACGTSSGIGILNACLAAHRLVTDVRPGLIVMTGIAGSLSDDAHLGDAVIASAVVHYLAEAKAVDKGKTAFDLRLDGQTTPIDPRLTDTIRRFIDEFHRDEQTWRNLRTPFAEQDYLSADALEQRRRTSERPQVLFGKVASGDITCGSRNFQELLTRKDRKILAIDMESAGAATVATSFRIPWFFVRGISDYSDERKSELDLKHTRAHEPVGPWRRHAAELAGRILVALLPHLAQSLRLGSNEGVSRRERALQLRHGGQPSPSTLERREIAAFEELRTEPIPPEASLNFRKFCDRFLTGDDQRVYAMSEEPYLCMRRTPSDVIEISAVSPCGEHVHSFGRIGPESAAWDPDVEFSTEERLQNRFAQIALWLDNVPSRHDKEPVSFAAVDVDGNVTVGRTLYLRRFSRTIDTHAWTSRSKLGDMRVELIRMLGASEQDGPELVRAVRRSIATQGLGVETSHIEGIA